jgi:hypothetical protein
MLLMLCALAGFSMTAGKGRRLSMFGKGMSMPTVSVTTTAAPVVAARQAAPAKSECACVCAGVHRHILKAGLVCVWLPRPLARAPIRC